MALVSAGTTISFFKASCQQINAKARDLWQQDTVSVSATREFRGVWIATVLNLDWPSQAGISSEQQQNEFIDLLERIQALNFNAIILQIRPTGDAFYQSELEPWSYWLTGEQGKPHPEHIKDADSKSTEQHRPFPDDKTYQFYQQQGGKLSKADWRRDNVNKIIERLSVGIKNTKEHVKFGISPFGIYRPGQPPSISASID